MRFWDVWCKGEAAVLTAEMQEALRINATPNERKLLLGAIRARSQYVVDREEARHNGALRRLKRRLRATAAREKSAPKNAGTWHEFPYRHWHPQGLAHWDCGTCVTPQTDYYGDHPRPFEKDYDVMYESEFRDFAGLLADEPLAPQATSAPLLGKTAWELMGERGMKVHA